LFAEPFDLVITLSHSGGDGFGESTLIGFVAGWTALFVMRRIQVDLLLPRTPLFSDGALRIIRGEKKLLVTPKLLKSCR
jgi:hypothetical protein